jgi:clathrin coat assembly protein AP180
MPIVFKRAVNSVKDQATICLVRFSGNYMPENSHEEQMADEKHITEVILMVISSTISAAACVHALACRIARTHDWVVALKSLQLVQHLLRDGGTYFSHEAASLRPIYSGGRRLLDLSNFSASQSSYSNPWDYTTFVRTYARYLDARFESAFFGKLQNLNQQSRKATHLVRSMKPAVLLDHIEHWRRLLDHVISMKPTGPTRNNRLIQITLFMVTCESFEFYRDITLGLTLLLDNFFQLGQKCHANTVETCELAEKEFEELDSFYGLCIKIGIGKMI